MSWVRIPSPAPNLSPSTGGPRSQGAETSMSSWGDGYVTDMGYTSGFHREMAPAHMAFAAALKSQAVPDITAPLTYCDLGCGQGVNTNLMAAAYPHIEFHGNDFNPAHVVGARRLAAEAGSTNVHF